VAGEVAGIVVGRVRVFARGADLSGDEVPAVDVVDETVAVVVDARNPCELGVVLWVWLGRR